MTRKHDEREIRAALDRLASGESQANVARSLNVHPSTIRIWRRRGGAIPAPESAPRANAVPPVLPPAVAQPAAAEPLPAADSSGADLVLEALASARGGEAAAPATDPAAAPAGEPAVSIVPAMSAEQLIDAAEAINGIVVTLIVSMSDVTLTDAQHDGFASFSARDKRALRPFAPYAARIAPQLLQHFDKIAAGIFLLLWGTNIAKTWKAIGRLEESQKSTQAAAQPSDSGGPVGFAVPRAQA